MRAFALLILAAAAHGGTPNYSIQTIAGSDLVGDNGPATQAFVSILEGVCADSSGNIFIADANDNRIRRIDANGDITTFAGNGTRGFSGDGGPANQAQLSAPYGIRLDATGNLYIADLGNGRVREVTTDGNISTVATGLNAPRNIAIDPHGNAYVSEFGGHKIDRINGDGTVTVFAGTGTAGFAGDGGPAAEAQINSPAGIAFDGNGVFYFADSGNARVRYVDLMGNVQTAAGQGASGQAGGLNLGTPTGVATDSANALYVTNANMPYVFKVFDDGQYKSLPGVGRDIFVMSSGTALVVGNQHLEEIAVSGSVTTLFSSSAFSFGDGGPATQAHFESVSGIALDPSGNLVVVDRSFRRLRQVSPNGSIATLPASDYVLDPRRAVFDSAGRLFVSDRNAINLESETEPASPVFAGLKDPGDLTFNQNGEMFFLDQANVEGAVIGSPVNPIPGSEAAAFSSPQAVATDVAGNVYVADAGTNLVVKIDPSGAVTSFAGTGTAGLSGDGGPAASAELNAPEGLAVDGEGNLWIADTGNNRIRFVDSSGIIHNAAGTGLPGLSGDGGNALAARLSSPTALAIDGSGDVYFADSGNQRVRLLTPGALKGYVGTGGLVVTHAATFEITAVAPGSIVALFGENLGPADGVAGTLDADGKLGTQLASTEVMVDGVPAPLYYAGANQINAQIPVEAQGRVSALVEVSVSGVITASTLVDIANANPGLFQLNHIAAAINGDGTANGADHPASPGGVIVLFGTGFGTTNPSEQTGVPAGATFQIPMAPVTVSINGEPAQVLWVGDAPGFVGLTQINVQIPSDALAGTVPVEVTAGTQTSSANVYLYIG